jgi:hypothetical protein
MDNVAAGYTVVMSDYEGEDAAYGVSQQSGYETLDAIRAAENWLGAPEDVTPVGMLGYSRTQSNRFRSAAGWRTARRSSVTRWASRPRRCSSRWEYTSRTSGTC